MPMFDGLPLHPLVVHAPLVMIPLVAAGLVLLLVRPNLRRPVAPIVAVLAVVAAVTAAAAAWSGEQLGDVLGPAGELDLHQTWGELTRTFAALVAVGAVALVAADRLRMGHGMADVLRIATTGLAIAAVGVVGIAGHAGARLAWSGRLPEGEVAMAAESLTAEGSPVRAEAPGSGPSPADGTVGSSGTLPGEGALGIDVALGEWALVPAVDEAPPGTITFRFRNLGTVPHALRIRTPGSGRDRLEWRSELVAPGETGLLVAELGPGTYEIDCPVEDGHGEHDQLGMEILFLVRDGAEPLAPLTARADATGDGALAPAEQPAGPPSPTVDVRGFAFEPPEVHVPAGAEVTWANHDPAPHTATGQGFDTGHLAQGESALVGFDGPGTYDYVCAIHPAMRGRVIVDP